MEPVNLSDFESLARARMAEDAFDYVSGGAGDETTLHLNRAAWGRWAIRPRVLVDVSAVDTSTEILGTPLAFPALIAPTAFQTLAHPEGERAMARAAAAAGTLMIVSTLASTRLEDVATAAPNGPRWFQLYCYRERPVTESLVRRAEDAGYQAICLTVDVPRIGRRERDLRNRFAMPDTAVPRNFEEDLDLDTVPTDRFRSDLHAWVASLLDHTLTWEAVDWLRSLTSLPILVKGVMTAEDACRAREHGADGIVVSNHGGRQLDGVLPTAEVLPGIVEAVGTDLPVLVDGGIRRGTDVLKALALGAAAVLIGRPAFWALGAGGQEGVEQMLTLLQGEIELALALAGVTRVADLGPDRVVRQITAETGTVRA